MPSPHSIFYPGFRLDQLLYIPFQKFCIFFSMLRRLSFINYWHNHTVICFYHCLFFILSSKSHNKFYISYIFLNTCVQYYKVFCVYKVQLKEFSYTHSVFMGKLYIILTACSRSISLYTHTKSP